MRLLQMCTAFRTGGIQRHVLDLSTSLRARGHHVAMAGTPGNWLTDDSDETFLALDLDGVAEQGGARHTTSPQRGHGRHALRPFLRRERIQLIHAHESAPALVAWMATIGMSIPTLVTYHGSEPERVACSRGSRALSHVASSLRAGAAPMDLRRAGVPASKTRGHRLGHRSRDRKWTRRLGSVRAPAFLARTAAVGRDGRAARASEGDRRSRRGRPADVRAARRHPVRGRRRRSAARRCSSVDRASGCRTISDARGLQRSAARVPCRSGPLPAFFAMGRVAHHHRRSVSGGLPVVATDAGGVRELVDETVGSVVAIGDVEALDEQVLDDLR